jgi:hypothetical protein
MNGMWVCPSKTKEAELDQGSLKNMTFNEYLKQIRTTRELKRRKEDEQREVKRKQQGSMSIQLVNVIKQTLRDEIIPIQRTGRLCVK